MKKLARRTWADAQTTDAQIAQAKAGPETEPLNEDICRKKKRTLRKWKKMSNDELVAFVQEMMRKNGISGRCELRKINPGGYAALTRREKKSPGLMAKVGFEDKKDLSKGKRPTGSYSKRSDDELVTFVQGIMREKGISGRFEFQKADKGAYTALKKREESSPGIMERVGFEKKKDLSRMRRPRNFFMSMSDDELVAFAQAFMKERGIVEASELKMMDNGLCIALGRRSRKNPQIKALLGFIDKTRDWTLMSDDELVTFVQAFMKERGISGRWELEKADEGIYHILRKREREKPGLMAQVGFEERIRPSGFFEKMEGDELVKYAHSVLDGSRIGSRAELKQKDGGMYEALRKRRLIDLVFFKIDNTNSERGLDAVCEALEEFGEGG